MRKSWPLTTNRVQISAEKDTVNFNDGMAQTKYDIIDIKAAPKTHTICKALFYYRTKYNYYTCIYHLFSIYINYV